MTDLSIIIVNYKCWKTLQYCLNSFKQFPPKLSYEIIIVDNDSQDERFESFSQQNPEVQFIKNTGNNGFSNGCNLGASYAQSEYLLFLNPDIVLTESPAIDTMIEFAKNNTDIGAVSCRTVNLKGKLEREIAFLNPWLTIGWLRALYRLIFKKEISEKFPKNNDIWYPEWIAGSVVIIDKVFFNKIGRWSQQYFWMYSEDPDLCKKIRNQNKEIALLRSVHLKHAHGGSSRRNPLTTAITKSEVVTSSHVFIQKHTQGLNRVALHAVIMINTLVSWTLRVLITAVIFWRVGFRANFLTLTAVVRYYLNVPIRKTWKSKRLIANEKG